MGGGQICLAMLFLSSYCCQTKLTFVDYEVTSYTAVFS